MVNKTSLKKCVAMFVTILFLLSVGTLVQAKEKVEVREVGGEQLTCLMEIPQDMTRVPGDTFTFYGSISGLPGGIYYVESSNPHVDASTDRLVNDLPGVIGSGGQLYISAVVPNDATPGSSITATIRVINLTGQLVCSKSFTITIVSPCELSPETCPVGITYQVHAKGLGWMDWVGNGAVAGTTGQNRQLEAVRAELTNAPDDMEVCYRVHIKRSGWSDVSCDGDMAGTTGRNRRIEAVEMWLNNAPTDTDICYRVHMKDRGWGGVECNGDMAGTTGQNRRIEAIEIEIVQ